MTPAKRTFLMLLLMAGGALSCSHPTFAQSSLSPGLTAKAGEFKEADNKYRTLCNGPQSARDQAKGARDYLHDDLQKLIANEAAASPRVQKALDSAAAIGDAADKIAASGASGAEKALAKDKYDEARKELRETAAREKAFIESELGRNTGVTFGEPEACGGKSATLSQPDTGRPRERVRSKKQARSTTRSASSAAPTQAAAPAFTPSVSIGGGGSTFSLSGPGGGSISFGR